MGIFDISDDANKAELHALSLLAGLPDLAKQGSDGPASSPSLPESLFAYPKERRLPCHNAAATLVSGLFWAKQADACGLSQSAKASVSKNIDRFAAYWGVADDLARAAGRMKAASVVDEDLPDSSYVRVGEGRMRLHNAMDVQAATIWLRKKANDMGYRDRRALALAILDRGAEMGAKLAGDDEAFLQKRAGRGLFVQGELAPQIKARLRRLPDQGHAAKELMEFAKTAAAHADEDPAAFLDALCAFDQRHGIKYNGKVLPPEEFMTGISLKEAGDIAANMLVFPGGEVYEKSAVAKSLDPESIKNRIGADIHEAVTSGGRLDMAKFADVAPTLPRPDLDILFEVFQEAGLSPRAKMAADFRPDDGKAAFWRMAADLHAVA